MTQRLNPSLPSDPERNACSSSWTIESPIFLIGSERSGTTLLRLMLDHHPEIAFNLESEFFVSDISDNGIFPGAADYRNGLRGNRVFGHSHFIIHEDLDFPALVNDFLLQKVVRDRKRIVGATVHYGFSKLRYLWPKARYIYLLRDGRDVACSVVDMGWAGNAFVGANWWLEAEREWEQFQKVLPRDSWIELRYEDLVQNSEAQLRRLCNFIGVNFSERMYGYVATSGYSLPDPTQAFKWREKLGPGELRLLEARMGAQLSARGYELTFKVPLRVGQVRTKWMQCHSRLGVLRHKIKMFGLRLLALECVSRRLRWTSLHSSTRRAMDAIIDRNLR
jgi:hypothetical protein